MPGGADAAECSDSFLDFLFARLSAPSEQSPEELAAEHSEEVWSSGVPDASPDAPDSWADASALHSSLGLGSADEVACCSATLRSGELCGGEGDGGGEESAAPIEGLGADSARGDSAGPDSVSCSATLRSGELCGGEGDGGGEESAAPIEGLGADSARGDSAGHDALSTDSVGHADGELEDMRRTDEGEPLRETQRHHTYGKNGCGAKAQTLTICSDHPSSLHPHPPLPDLPLSPSTPHRPLTTNHLPCTRWGLGSR